MRVSRTAIQLSIAAALLCMLLSVLANAASTAPNTTLEVPLVTLELLGRWHGGPVFSSVISGDYIYYGMGGSIRVVKINPAHQNNTASWKQVASITTAGVVHDIDAAKDHLYVADDSGALRIIDISTPTKPVEVAEVPLKPNVRAVSVLSLIHI